MITTKTYSYNVVTKETHDSGFGGEAKWLITQKVVFIQLHCIFEIFSAVNNSLLRDKTLITQVYGDSNYKVITFPNDYNSNDHDHTTVILQFTSNGQAGEMTFEIRYYGSAYNQNIIFYFTLQ